MNWHLTRDRRGYKAGPYVVRKDHRGQTWKAWLQLVDAPMKLDGYSIDTRKFLGGRFPDPKQAMACCEQHRREA